ncbi:MAG TPA: GNAT family N-acetyltransferase [Longimicrobiales bacterium]|nr:GNAT family N-acetyltransferase [Longimicrobiales bacterium]
MNVGTPREISWRGRTLTTAIHKAPVSGAVPLRTLNLEGDAQADPTVHGGPDKAVYLYPREHYAHWEEVLGRSLEPGALGENLTSTGILETDLGIGDEVAVGTALLQVSQPRLPCVKLAARHGRADLPALFTRAGRPGIYFRVLREGAVQAGDGVAVTARARERWSVTRVAALLSGLEDDPAAAARLAGHPLLGQGARKTFRTRTGFHGTVDIATRGEVEGLQALLTAAGLPVEGFPGDTPVVLAAVDGEGRLLGGVALEIHGDAGLLRSAVVRPGSRGSGVGGALVSAVLARAWGEGLHSVSLLTETAGDYFPRFGFRRVTRDRLPGSLGASVELRGACPDSAVVMTLPAPASSPGT